MTPRGARRRTSTVRTPIAGALRQVVAVLAATAAIVNGYLAVLTVAAYVRSRRHLPGPSRRAPGRHRLDILVPAHDEEAIIASTIDSMLAQRYPAARFGVHVVADNCTDRTAEVARAHGAQVHERSDVLAPGKGPALGWLVERLLAQPDPPDAMVIVDADTTLSPEFLAVIDTALDGRGSAWQAYYSVRDPEVSPSTALRYAALALRHYVRPIGRTALGGSCGLFGNGMVFRTELLRDRRFSAHLTEDVEFQLDLLLDGELVGFLPDALVEAEMPATLEAARSQNERWELGRVQLARQYVPELARRAVRRQSEHRVAYADAALDQIVPPLSVLAAGTGTVAAVATAVALGTRSRRGRAGVVLAWLSVIALALHVVAGLRLARAPRAVYVALLQAPRLVAWKVSLCLRVLLRPNEVSWRRTQRNEPAENGPAAS